MLPPHAGIPLGETHGGATYFMLETHYDNPNMHTDIVDDSGVRIYYTEKVKEFNSHATLNECCFFTTQNMNT